MPHARRFTDAVGRSVRLPERLQRLVSLVPSITEVLFDFGYGSQVMGITDFCTEPAAEVVGKIRIGGTKNPDVPAILDLQPDLVLAVAEENRREDVAHLEAAGIAVFVFEPRTVRDGIDLLWRVADLLGCRDHVSSAIMEIERHYAETVRMVSRRQRVRVFCPIWKNPYMTINHDTYVHDVLHVCGGDNVFGDRTRRYPLAADLGDPSEFAASRTANRDRRYPRVRLEEMAVRRPDVILLPDEPYVFSAEDIADFTRFEDVPAVRNGRIHLIDGKMVSWYGTRLGRSLCALRDLLRPLPLSE